MGRQSARRANDRGADPRVDRRRGVVAADVAVDQRIVDLESKSHGAVLGPCLVLTFGFGLPDFLVVTGYARCRPEPVEVIGSLAPVPGGCHHTIYG